MKQQSAVYRNRVRILSPINLATTLAGRARQSALIAIFVCATLSLSACHIIFRLDEVSPPVYSNYYTCDCNCSRRVIAPTGAAVFTFAGSNNLVGTAIIGDVGWINDGPTIAELNGQSKIWWQVDFDTKISGWVIQDNLNIANEFLMSKQAQTCLPPEFNRNLGGVQPTLANIQSVCGLVNDEVQTLVNANSGARLCSCEAQSIALTDYNASCDQSCPNGEEVCLIEGYDPPQPTPELVSATLFTPASVCALTGDTGDVYLAVDGHEPKVQPTVSGNLQIRGRPCRAGETCKLAISYQLTGSDIEFDSGSVFASDPKFVDLSMSGATEPEIINMGELLQDFYLGEVPAGTARTTAYGRRSGSTDAFSTNYQNAVGLALGVNWANKTCRIAGDLAGQVAGDNSEELDALVSVALDGVILNQPPWPDAGEDQIVECTASDGADVTLDASGSHDADANVAYFDWRYDSGTGTQIVKPSLNPVVNIHQSLGAATYHLQVVDSWFAADNDSVEVSVTDTTAPAIYCNSPASIYPSDVPEKRYQGISFTASADDSCTGVSSVVIESFTCTKPASCRVSIEGDTITILDSGGVGDTISWAVSAVDGEGNQSQMTCELNVIRKKK